MTLADDGKGLIRVGKMTHDGKTSLWLEILDWVTADFPEGTPITRIEQMARGIEEGFTARLREERKKAYSNAIEIVRSGFTVDVGVVERLRKLAEAEEGS
jgi:hypothetical protein